MKRNLILIAVVAFFSQTAFAQPDNTEQTSRLEMASSDGTVRVHVESNLPEKNTPLVINVRFSNVATGSILHDVNYDIVAMQNGEIVLSQLGMYAENGLAHHTTSPLSTDNHVEVMIVLQGIGSEAPYSGPHGETIEVTVVPEFGQIAFLVLFLASTLAIVTQKAARTT